MEFVESFKVQRTGKNRASNVYCWTIDDFLKQNDQNKETIGYMVNEYLDKNRIVRPYYDYDFHYSDDEECPTDKFEEYYADFRKTIEKLHPNKEIAYASRTGWKPYDTATSDGKTRFYIISLRAYVKGVKCKVTDIKKHILKILGTEPSHLDLTVYKPKDQCLGVVNAHKKWNDKRILQPLTHQDDQRAFVTQYLYGDEEELKFKRGRPATLAKETNPKRMKKSTTTITTTENGHEEENSDEEKTYLQIPTDLIDVLCLEYGFMKDEVDKMCYEKGRDEINIRCNTRRCIFIQGEHASNHQYITITRDGRVDRRCYDEVCRNKSKQFIIDNEEQLKKLFSLFDDKDKTTLAMIELGKLETKEIINDTYVGNEDVDVQYVGDQTNGNYTYNAELVSFFGNRMCCQCGSTLNFNIGPQGYCVVCSNKECSFRLPYGEDHIVINKKYTNLPTVFAKIYIQNNINNNYYNNNDNAVILDAECFVEDGLVLDTADQVANRLFLNALIGTQVRIANVFHHFYKESLVYCNPTWYQFNGVIWEELSINTLRSFLYSEKMMQPFITAKKFYKSGTHGDVNTTNAKIRKITKIMEDLENRGPQDGILEQCKALFEKKPADFTEKLNVNKYLIGFNNGVYDYKIGKFRQATKEDMVSMTVGYDYDEAKMNNPEIRAKLLECFSQIFPSTELRHYVLKFLASCLTGYTNDQLIHIGHGNGSNGKSLLMSLMADTLGSYAAKIESSFICGPTPGADKPTPTLTSLVRRRFVYISETVPGDKLNEQLYKALSGADKMTYRPLYGEMKCFVPEFKMFMVCNDLPNFNGNDYAMLRRLRVNPFLSTFVDEIDRVDESNHIYKKNTELFEEILGWKEAFMGLLLQYLMIYKKEGLVDVPVMVMNATAKYSSENNFYQQFIDEKIQESEDSFVRAVDLYDTFRVWVKKIGINERYTQSKLGIIFKKMLKSQRKSIGTVFVNISLVE